MPVLRFPFYLRRESDLSALTKQRLGFRLYAVCVRFAGIIRETVTANPELFLPVFLLFVWQITAIAVKPLTLGLALLMTLLLLVYGYRVLGKTPWLRRLGWVSPCQGFWFYSVLAGLASGGCVWSIARLFHESLGGVPPPHRVLLASASGPMVEEMLFRGIFFWLIFELLRRGRVPKLAAVSATILVIAVGFAFSHTGRTGLSLYTTILTGIAFGWMRAQSESTAAAALMHAVYNLGALVYCDVLAPPLPLLHRGLPPLFGRTFYRRRDHRLVRNRPAMPGAFQAQHQIARMKVNQQGPSPFSRRRLLYNRPSDFRQELCPLPSGILAETGTTPGGAVPCRTDICGRSVSGQPAFFDTSYRRRSSRYRERRTPPELSCHR